MRNVMRSLFPGDRPDQQDVHLDSLMAGDDPSPAVEPLLRALAAEPRQHELGGFEEPLARYRTTFPTSRPSARRTWRPSMLASLLGAKLGAIVAGVAVGLSGTAVAAYTGALPTGAQNLAHTTIGAPAATPSAAPKPKPKPKATGKPVGPDAKGPAAHGLCNAWTQHQKNGAKPTKSVAFRNLATAAGGEGKIAAYCAKVPKPGNSNHPTGKPTAKSTGKPSGKGTGKPASLPTPTSTTQR